MTRPLDARAGLALELLKLFPSSVGTDAVEDPGSENVTV